VVPDALPRGTPRLNAVPLTRRWPQVSPERLVAELVPPPRFRTARFATYDPDPAQPSQRDAVRALQSYAGSLSPQRRSRWRRTGHQQRRGRYLDGGFGVGKTHLLAALWHEAPQPSAYGTFVGYTHLVGALGFHDSVRALSAHRLVCIDEFELDDPGDTVLMSTLLTRLADAGVSLAATSNTLPGALGEGRFAAVDFLREIQALSARFDVVHIEGEDYRHRGFQQAPSAAGDAETREWASAGDAALDDFDDLLHHLAQVHPSRYGALLDEVHAVAWTGVHPVDDQAVALRLVVLTDRLYDRDIPLLVSGTPVDRVFPEPLLRGGYRKKYYRAVSRLTALAREAHPPTHRAGR